jgi:hypothetical protein
MKKYLFFLPILLLLANCATYNPLYDPKSSKDGGKNFYSDLKECEDLVDRLEGWFEADLRTIRIDNCMKHRHYSVL